MGARVCAVCSAREFYSSKRLVKQYPRSSRTDVFRILSVCVLAVGRFALCNLFSPKISVIHQSPVRLAVCPLAMCLSIWNTKTIMENVGNLFPLLAHHHLASASSECFEQK